MDAVIAVSALYGTLPPGDRLAIVSKCSGGYSTEERAMNNWYARAVVMCLFLLPFFVASSWTTALRAQVYDSLNFPVARNLLSIDLGGVAINTVSVRYHRAIDSGHAVGASAGFVFYPVGNQRLTGYQFLIHYRFYPDRQALWRLYYGGQVGFGVTSATEPDARLTAALLAALVGWQYFPLENFGVGAAVGLGHRLGARNQVNPVLDRALGLQGIFMFDLGYAF